MDKPIIEANVTPDEIVAVTKSGVLIGVDEELVAQLKLSHDAVKCSPLRYDKGEQNPLDEMTFYSKKKPKAHQRPAEILPLVCQVCAQRPNTLISRPSQSSAPITVTSYTRQKVGCNKATANPTLGSSILTLSGPTVNYLPTSPTDPTHANVPRTPRWDVEVSTCLHLFPLGMNMCYDDHWWIYGVGGMCAFVTEEGGVVTKDMLRWPLPGDTQKSA